MMTKVEKLMQRNPDLTLGGYLTAEERLKKHNPELHLKLYPNSRLLNENTFYDENEDLASEHNQKSYEYIHELLDLLEKNKCILKRPQVGASTSYGWKHRVEAYTRKKRGKNSHHWIANGLFIAVLRERNLPVKQADELNAWVPLGKKAYKFCDKHQLWG